MLSTGFDLSKFLEQWLYKEKICLESKCMCHTLVLVYFGYLMVLYPVLYKDHKCSILFRLILVSIMALEKILCYLKEFSKGFVENLFLKID